ncbi:hypothetical protein ACH5RR_008607 [Cinchona calisaya]|uniref:RNase H type-1 domain-containing protein n=1 Tax=Cinchona calisaya TaxID=153742 RepID=A0ABD3AFG3_9GENT
MASPTTESCAPLNPNISASQLEGLIASMQQVETVPLVPNCRDIEENSLLHVTPARMTFVYAKCTRIERFSPWSSLCSIEKNISSPWLLCGDFNIISSIAEYLGKAAQDIETITDFNSAMGPCGDSSLFFSSGRFIWAGNLLAGFAKSFGSCRRLEAKSLALVEGLLLCITNGYTHALIELDSLALLRKLHAEIGVPWRLEHLIIRVGELLQRVISFYCIFIEKPTLLLID